jgi:diguanylate cyclase (GGDEF)-like protein/PAS domain S-box-containing protein
MTLKARIATTMLVVEALLIALVLAGTLRFAAGSVAEQVERRRALAGQLLGELAPLALGASARPGLQAALARAARGPDIAAIELADRAGKVIAASDRARLGAVLAVPADAAGPVRMVVPIEGGLGQLAVTFTDAPIAAARQAAWRLGLALALAGTFALALAGLVAGHLLTRTLAGLADTAEAIAAGDGFERAVVPGNDEVARLGRALNSIVTRLESHVRELRDARDRLIKPAEAMSEGFALWDSRDRLVLHNRQFCKLLAPIECSIRPGMQFALLARLLQDCLLVRGEAGVEGSAARALIARHRAPQGSHELQLHCGRWLSVYEFSTPEGEVVSIYSDITERKEREHALQLGKRRLGAIMNSVVDGILTATADGRIEDCNAAAARIFGYAEAELVGRRLDELIDGIADLERPRPLSVKGLAVLPVEEVVEMTGRRRDGSALPIELSVTEVDLQGQPAFIATVRDITARKATEEMIRYQATHDALTDLPNRVMFDQKLQRALELAARTGETLGVMFLDLDRFKMINDSLGHSMGDALLVGLSQRLRASIGDEDVVARMGGDEFILILHRLASRDEAMARAQRILDAIRPPFHLDRHELHITASIGISLFPNDGRSAEQLLTMADLALYQAKGAGRNRPQLFKPTMNASVQEQMRLETDLRRALDQGQLAVVYQPQIHLASGELVGLEALARWQHPEFGQVSPEQFIPLAEETGLIQELGLWILRTACGQHRRWRQAGLRPLRLAVNMSACQFRQASLEQDLQAVFGETRMALDYLELELTESVLMQEGETAELLKRLTESGVSIALDDFGTGYSSLSYLRRFPIERIKIDRSFVREIDTNSSDCALARAVVGMAHGLNIQVIAEGVETNAQLALLKHFGCDEAQGFFFGAPLTGEAVPAFAHDRHRPARGRLVAAELA